MSQNRQPAGVPTGGQFAAGSQGRATVSLDGVSPEIAGAKADEAYADFVTSIYAQNNAAVTTAATAVRAVYPSAERIWLKPNPDYIHDGERYTIDRITGPGDTVLADEKHWPDSDTPDWNTLVEAQYAIGALVDNEIDIDHTALSDTHGIDHHEDTEQDYIAVGPNSLHPQMLGYQKDQLAKAKQRIANNVGTMNETAVAAIEAITARDYPTAATVVIERNSDGRYQVDDVRDADGASVGFPASHQALDPYVQNIHEGYDSYLSHPSFSRAVDVVGSDTIVRIGQNR